MPMMEASDFSGAVPVDGYGPGFFRVKGVLHHCPVLVTGQDVHDWGGLDDVQPLLDLAGRIDVLFLGMGADIAIPPRDLIQALDGAGIMAEPMNTASAARSYNVTLSEGRRVACALIPL